MTNKLAHANETSFFRPTINYWRGLTSYISQRFKDVPKVNTYVYGCSDGSDAYSFILSMYSILKDGCQKYLPITAKDYDSFAIEKALSGEVYLSEREAEDISSITNIDNYFKKISNGEYLMKWDGAGCEYLKGEPAYKVSDLLLKQVNFSQADIKKDYVNIEPNNSIIFARNFWPYIKPNCYREKLAQDLYNRLEGNSILIIGYFDGLCDSSIKSAYSDLLDAGFKVSPVDYCFVKNI